MSRVRSLFDKLQRRSSNERASSPQQAHSVWQKASWAVTDKQKMEQLVKEIQSLNNQLFKFLQHQAVVDIQKTQDMMSRALMFLCNNNAELKNVEDLLSTNTTATSVKEAALVKKWRLMLKTDLQNTKSALQRASTGLADADIRYFSFQKLSSAISQEKQGVCVAEHNDWTVFVEWRTIPNNGEAMKASLKRLAKLIQVANDPAFQALPCQGYVEHVEIGRFGLVSNITYLTTSTPAVSFKTASLNDLIKQRGWAPLATRMRIAYEMAEAVLQLHTVGWLHKSIHSGNIRFVIPNPGQANKIALEKPYPVGYDYARPDTESGAALTENADWIEEGDFTRISTIVGRLGNLSAGLLTCTGLPRS